MPKLTVTIGNTTHRLEIEGKSNHYSILLDGKPHEAELLEIGKGHYSLRLGTRQHDLFLSKNSQFTTVYTPNAAICADLQDTRRASAAKGPKTVKGPFDMKAGMPGKIARILVTVGQQVKPETGIMVVEAMKMENEIKLGYEAVVDAILVQPGQLVETGANLVRFAPVPAAT